MAPTTKTTKDVDEQAGAYVGPRAANSQSARPTASSADRSLQALVDPTSKTESMTPSLGVIATDDRCSNCGYPMASDQHYCLECGERRGQARFAATPRTASRTAKASEPGVWASRFSPGTTLVAGVATLLLAMGIGVLIGEQGNSSDNSKTPVVYLNGNSTSGGSAATSSGAGSAATGSQSSGGASGSHRSSTRHSGGGGGHSTVKTVQGSAPPTVTVGAKGSGKGYQHGHFTGNFFGP